MGVMLARNQDSGSFPVMSDFLKIRMRARANSLAVSWMILRGTSSGPDALFGSKP